MDKFPDDLGDIMTLPQLRKHITEIIMDEKKKHPEGGYAEFVLPSDHNGTAVMRELGQIFNIFGIQRRGRSMETSLDRCPEVLYGVPSHVCKKT